MKKIYFLHGYQTSGKKFLCLEDYYRGSTEYSPICWNWNENMDIPSFIKEKALLLKNDTGEKILMADSMGANLAWHLVNLFPNLQYVMTNPVFSAEQIKDQELILSDMRAKIFSATSENISNKNINLIISKYDEVLNPEYYKKVLGDSFKPLELEDEHKIIKMKEYMPLIHHLIEEAFNKSKA